MSRTLSLWGPVVVYMAAIFVVSSLSAPPLPSGVSDISGHALAYAGLGMVVVRALAGGWPKRITWRIGLAALAITVGYGVTDELHQMFVPGRVADIADIYADLWGAAAGTAACWAWGIIAVRPESAGPAR